MSMQTLERMVKQLEDLVKHLTGQQHQWQACRQYCPVKPEHPVRRQQRNRYYQ